MGNQLPRHLEWNNREREGHQHDPQKDLIAKKNKKATQLPAKPNMRKL
jgi:hypothetical protein